MRKLAFALLTALPLFGGCYAYVPARPYYYRPAARVYVAPRPVYVAPPAVYVPPPRVRVYW